MTTRILPGRGAGTTARLGVPVVLLALVLGLLAAVTTVTVSSVVTATPARAATSSSARTYERKAKRTTNRQRARRGLARLDGGSCLRRMARQQASRMRERGKVSHQDLSRVAQICGVSRVAENVASGYPSGRKVVNRGWMRSSTHRANLLDRGFRRVGVGAVRGASGRWWVAQLLATP